MSDRKRWDELKYQRMRSVQYDAGRLAVSFEDGSATTIDVSRVLPHGAQHPDWQQLEFDPYEIHVAASAGPIEIPWSTIRVLTDPEYAEHLTVAAKEQSRSIGRRIRELRKDGGLSVEQLAKRSGQSAERIASIERGEDEVNFTTLRSVLTAMGCTLADLAQDSTKHTPADC